jgi:replicative DNA helicase
MNTETETELERDTFRDAEESIVSYLLKNPQEISEHRSSLKSKAFGLKECRIIYESLLELDRLESPIDAVQLEIFLIDRSKLEIIGGVKGLARIAGGNKLVRQPSQQAIAKTITTTIERHKRAELLQQTTALQAELMDMTVPYSNLSEKVEKYALDFMSGGQTIDRLKPISATISDTVSNVVDRVLKKREGINAGIPTGWVDIDKLTGGWRGGKLITVAARPHMGKSLFAGNALVSIAKTRPSLFFSLEMSSAEIEERFLSAESKIDSAKIRDGNLDDAEIDRLISASNRLSSLQFWGDDNFGMTVDSIVAECRRFKAKNQNMGAVAIDYLQLLCEGDNANQEISKITRKLKCLAGELDCPIFLLSQLNRGVESRNDKRPIMSDLRDSGAIEQDSDMIIMLYRDVVYNPDCQHKDLAEVIFRKFRNGVCGTVKLIFDGPGSCFKNYAGY